MRRRRTCDDVQAQQAAPGPARQMETEARPTEGLCLAPSSLPICGQSSPSPDADRRPSARERS
eukprot:CAMPEP_0183520392 /NCGR_PEP_ID=MMETSP0371-20130417/16891_1 /TAXON_ID=268820 /ORGANISM="Peridinium aciculiferum, Strain PAER-2" /LENGTH=62 /DNA_ID=CAMNT_0025718753 /DNA_START=108 /DNA_END=293 /DNA_ORIENTATION=-